MLLSMQSSVFLAFAAGTQLWLVFGSTSSFNLGLDFNAAVVIIIHRTGQLYHKEYLNNLI